MYHERLLATLEVEQAVDSMIGRDVATAKIVFEEWSLETANPSSIDKEKREEAFAEGEKRCRDAMFFSGQSDHKYGELKDNFHNSYLAGVNILTQMFDAILCMEDGFKRDTTRQHNSYGAHKDKAGMDFVRPAEVKEKKSAGIAKSPQSEAVAGVQKKDNGTMPPNEAGHSNYFHCGSNHHWSRDCDQLSKTQRQLLYATKPDE